MFGRLRQRARLERARELSRSGQVAEAVSIWRPLAEAGVARAQTNLGAALAIGAPGVPADAPQALHWLQRGANGGDVLGQRNLATLLLPSDPAASVGWYRHAAEAGDPESQDQLSHMLLTGLGTAADPAEARHWAKAAAGQGVMAASARLGTMCHDAVGGPRDPAAAVQWWRMAAAAGDGDSAARLGAALHMGQGVAADQVAAMAWLIIGAARHSILVRPFFSKVQDDLTPAQQAEAKELAHRLG